MQDNPFNEAFINEAWADMRAQLDEAMPVRPRRRLLVWWWMAGAGLMAILALVLQVGEGSNRSLPIESGEGSRVVAETSVQEAKDRVEGSIEKPTTAIVTPESISGEPTKNTKTSSGFIGQVHAEGAEVSLGVRKVNAKDTQDSTAEKHPASVDLNDSRVEGVVSKLSKPVVPVEYKDSLYLSFTQSEISLQEKKSKTKELHILAYTEGNYEPKLRQLKPTFGFGLLQRLGRWQFGIAPGLQWGQSSLDNRSPMNDLGLQEAEQDNSAGNPGTSFQPGSANADPLDIDFRFTNVRLPISIGYRISEKWTLETGIIPNIILQFSPSRPTDTEAYRSFQRNNSDPLAAANEAQPFTTLLQKRSFIQGQVGIHYQLAEQWQLYSSYQHAFSPVLSQDQLQWNRNFLTLGLRYEINSYIFGKK